MKKLIALRFLFLIFLALTVLITLPFFKNDISSAFAYTFNDKFDNLDNWKITRNTCSTNWETLNGRVGMKIYSPCISEIIPTNLVILPKQRYSYSIDMEFTNTIYEDRHIAFNYLDPNNWYDFKFYGNTIYFQKHLSGYDGLRILNYNFEDGKTYRFRIDVSAEMINLFVDNHEIWHFSDEAPYIQNPTTIALQAAAGGTPTSEVWFDNAVVKVDNYLTIPDFYQTDSRWANDIYDSANIWSQSPTIQSWGCALTSAVMVFRYYGINLLPNGNEILPSTLNNWLNQQKDGYLDGGYVNWIALSRLSKLTKPINKTSFDALESSVYDFSPEVIENDINNNNPVILDLGGHFVVAKSIFENVLGINDPYYQDKTSIDLNNITPKSLVRFTPSLTDLSYILITTKNNIKLQLEDNKKKLYGKYSSLEPIKNNFSEFQPSLNQFTLEKAESRNYYLKISGDKNKKYNLKFYFYNKDGNVKIIEYSGKTDKRGQDKFNIKFDKNDLKKDTIRPDGNEFGKLKED